MGFTQGGLLWTKRKILLYQPLWISCVCVPCCVDPVWKHRGFGFLEAYLLWLRGYDPRTVAASGLMVSALPADLSQTWVRRALHSRQTREFRGVSHSGVRMLSNPSFSMQKVVRAGNTVVLDEHNLHIRNTRDGTVIKLDVNSGVYTIDIVDLPR